MEAVRSERKFARRQHTQAVKKLNEVLSAETKDYLAADVAFQQLKSKEEELNKINERFLELARAEGMAEDSLEKEYDTVTEYKDAFVECSVKYHRFAKTETDSATAKALSDCNSTGPSAMSGSSASKNQMYSKPKLEIKTFDGAPQNWLPFWNQFKRIDEDETIDPQDKLQYLHQYTMGKVKSLVETYPQTEDNYDVVINHIKERFASDEILIRYYVREILNLVTNRGSSKIDSLYSSLETKLRALNSLGVTKDRYCDLLFPLVEAVLSDELLIAWHRQKSNIKTQRQLSRSRSGLIPGELDEHDAEDDLDLLLSFLRQEVENEERIKEVRSSFPHSKLKERPSSSTKGKYNEPALPTAAALALTEKRVETSEERCIFCDLTNHVSVDCFSARKLSVDERKTHLDKAGACFSCLKVGHVINNCKSYSRCLLCNRKHSIIVCDKLPDPQGSIKRKKEKKKPPDEKVENVTNASNQLHSNEVVYLPTIAVKIVGAGGEMRIVRALIDSGNQRSYVVKELAKELKLNPSGTRVLSSQLFGGTVMPKRTHFVYKLNVFSMDENFSFQFNVLDEDEICSNVPRLKTSELPDAPELTFSDWGPNPPPIQLLIGSDVEGRLCTGRIRQLECGLTAKETKLGWIISGFVSGSGDSELIMNCLRTDRLPELWDLDVLGIRDPIEVKSKEKLALETLRQFEEDVRVEPDGRYTVALPWIEGMIPPPNNLEIARKRLENVTKRLITTGSLSEYQTVFDEWEREGIVKVLPSESDLTKGYFLPHRPVIKRTSSTTKVRPVFDASCRIGREKSLNERLNQGPNLLETIPPLIIRFRWGQFGITGDIKKAFLQIGVRPEDRENLQFLWWEKGKTGVTLRALQHQRVVFGVNSSPFLLNAVINHHLKRMEASSHQFHPTIRKLQSAFYVDDCVTSVDLAEDVPRFVKEASEVMSVAKFELRQWTFTDPHVEFPTDSSELERSVLGVNWDYHADVLYCSAPLRSNLTKSLTKRELLSVASQIYDPIGFTSPVSLLPKLLMQETWIKGLGWEDILPEEIQSQFWPWFEELAYLEKCKIPRWLFEHVADAGDLSLHAFSDASARAYAAVVFIRQKAGNKGRVQLLLAKARVGPTKKGTIPRMELLGALLAVRLVQTVLQAIPFKIKCTFWSDSMVTLGWIKRDGPWGIFVSNRVQEIRRNSDTDLWRHVPGELNPADLPSRGCSARSLLESEWWNGPTWLQGPEETWPENPTSFATAEMAEEEVLLVKNCLNVSAEASTEGFTRYFSQYFKMVRSLAWALRFISNCRNPQNRKKGELSVDEIAVAEAGLLRLVQREGLTETEKRKSFPGCELYVDSSGLLRIKSRLCMGPDQTSFQEPVVLPAHEVTRRLIAHEHKVLRHAGVQTTLCSLRERFFIPKGRKLVRQVIRNCGRCKRFTAKAMEIATGPLPLERIERGRAFQVTGVDFAGPLYLKDGRKVWIALFTCAVYRAVHLEVVGALTTEAFLYALRRFIARRGRVEVIYSDNGTNFAGAANLLVGIDWAAVERAVLVKPVPIRWVFNPPSAAWWGGWWERLVGVLKGLLRRNLGRASLDLDEFETLLCECEAVMNSRPLSYLSDDPADIRPVTPAHFIQDTSETSTPDLDAIDSTALRQRWKYLNILKSNFRERFRKEYLSELRQRNSGRRRQVNNKVQVKVGDVVLIGDDIHKRLDWPLARVEKMYTGRDGVVRVAELRTAKGCVTRPLQRIYPLEVSDSEGIPIQKETQVSIDTKDKSITAKGTRVQKKNKVSIATKDKGTTAKEKKLDVELPRLTRKGRLVNKPKRFM